MYHFHFQILFEGSFNILFQKIKIWFCLCSTCQLLSNPFWYWQLSIKYVQFLLSPFCWVRFSQNPLLRLLRLLINLRRHIKRYWSCLNYVSLPNPFPLLVLPEQFNRHFTSFIGFWVHSTQTKQFSFDLRKSTSTFSCHFCKETGIFLS